MNISKREESTQTNYKAKLNGEIDSCLLDYVWNIRFDHKFKINSKPHRIPRFKQAISFLIPGYRCNQHLKECKSKNVQPHIEFFSPLDCKQIYGVPLGGLGTGSIGRTYSGDFCRFQLIPGIYEHDIAEANLFTINLRKQSKTIHQQVLTTRKSSDLKGFKNWRLNYPRDAGHYCALYPEAWYVYDLKENNVCLTCHQMSPIIPNNYRDTSLPVGLFKWTIENTGSDDIDVALMFTWQCGSSTNRFELKNVTSKFVDEPHLSGILIDQTLKNQPFEYFLSARKSDNCEITYDCQFYPDCEDSGTNLWQNLYDNGKLNNNKFNREKLLNMKMAVALSVSIHVKKNSKENVEFCLVWNMPQVSFNGDLNRKYNRFYTRYFPYDEDNKMDFISIAIADYSLQNREYWLSEIYKWREPILSNKSLPNFYKCYLFNEMYYLCDGGTIWLNIDPNETNTNKLAKQYGRFAYLEGHEYRLYNTYDVHFYASFALIQLWPMLQLTLQYDIADAIKKEQSQRTIFFYNGKQGIQKTKNCVPHDLGDPENAPFIQLNAYRFHDTKNWKDLNLEFILSVYRDYYYSNNKEFLVDMWPSIKRILAYIQTHDHDNDGLIDSLGEPDQTYDTWCVNGPSAYCGGLHVAALKIVCTIATLLNDYEVLDVYGRILNKAKHAYDTKLWNGKYYNYDLNNNSIMSDMCCGHWYLRCTGFDYQVFEREKIESCLNTIYENNVLKYGNGKYGAVNGMKSNGKIDTTSLQSEESWIGVTDSIASLMIYEDMSDTAWKMIENLYDTCYNQMGLAFQMPEALIKPNMFRSLGYMRPLCIWAIQYAIDSKIKNKLKS